MRTRSPYFIYRTLTNLTSANLDLYIYTGAQVGTMASITYSLTSTAYNDEVTWEIAELVRDYLDVTFDGNYTSQAVFVNYQITDYVSGVAQTPLSIVQLTAYDGYGYFEDGANPTTTGALMQSNTTVYKLDDAPLRIPVNADTATTVKYYLQGEEIYSKSISASTNTTSLINYVSSEADGVDNYQGRVIADGGTYEDSPCIQAFIRNNVIYGVDAVKITEGSNTTTLNVKDITECKYQPYKVTFVNKFGALQDLWFFKANKQSLRTTKHNYKSNLVTAGSYSISAHQNRILDKQGKESITLNTGFYTEDYNEVFRQLELSEKVWIEMDGVTLPIEVSNPSLRFKTTLNDKLISYTIDCEFAYDKINSVR